ncbi:NAD(P)-dependent oxidoreductase [Xanthomonas campestris]|uniref:precorrin-2 dehydrogenase n=1 Tax=Xanthomonas campestris pv. papavericola TaxID=487881 RepID=A0AAJ3CFC2_XANCA|nr:NAD(P)-dependent oxidoreductase [Xanthomonas campestris]MCC5064781.1 siroheme synthase [Xanthomonas campestris pv. raphani]MCW1981099.1 precorrin-2 dehydrogenase/sirohydrochlorin ferrochelatase [Xanthomonas campestris]MCW2003894.1 precorrin-2 dehydrogenase/sirohydrochlorin ferrochelatase [Xanthomonas campestris]MCW2006434.1 precorrin-2 dehydrogenase/sirohydrochlorin ferrochelatase [Xanthomonas campestris]MCW2037126.1 precorrin-2 dehydrogenase/sirohydrochlorin ferrochelatase [Xanthomonas cam
MPLFPLFANLQARAVLVIGGGEVATRKVLALLKAGAHIRLYAHALSPELEVLMQAGRFEQLRGSFDAAWIDDVWLVVAATDDTALNQQVAAAAGARQRLVNVVDDAELSTYQVPAIVDRDPLVIAISSAGAAPMLARRLRERLERELDASVGTFAGLFAHYRERIRSQFPDMNRRRRWFDRVIDGPVPLLLQGGDTAAADAAFRQALEDADAVPARGSVQLVGTGPGDPGLLTLKALRAMNLADVLLVAHDVPEAVVELARRDASRRVLPADVAEQQALLLQLAGDGLHVVALRGGAGFEAAHAQRIADALQVQGLACDQVPGVVAEPPSGD